MSGLLSKATTITQVIAVTSGAVVTAAGLNIIKFAERRGDRKTILKIMAAKVSSDEEKEDVKSLKISL